MEFNGFKIQRRGCFIPEHQGGFDNIYYPDSGNAIISELESQSHWFNARNNIIARTLAKYPFEGDFLDLGGGNGNQLAWLSEKYFKQQGIRSVLVEPGETGCANAVARGVNPVFCCNHREFPFHAFNIGGIGLFDVLEHIKADEKFLTELGDKLPLGGRIYITVLALKRLWSEEDRFSGHFRRFDKREEARIADIPGLKMVESHYFFAYFVPFVWLLRVLPERLGILTQSPEAIISREQTYHKGNPMVNGVLQVLHRMEQAFLSLSIKPFWGTSRLLVLEKTEV